LLAGGNATSFGLSFARNLILARILAKADYGMAAAFSMTIAMLELAGRMGFGKQIIQSKDGDSPHFEATAHSFQFIAGLLSAILMLVMCGPMADWFRVPEAAWAFALLAIVPFCKGLEHLDNQRIQRELRFVPSIVCEVLPQLIVTIAAWPLALWLKDYRAVLWVMVGKSTLGILFSHILSSRPYRWAWDPILMRGMLSFSWPLILNGLVMFLSKQGDQILVGAFLSMPDLAVYSICFSLAGIPWFVSSQVAFSVMLPTLARSQDNPESYRHQYRECLAHISIASLLLMVPLVLAGEQTITLLYGQKYAGSGMVMAALAAASAFRFQRISPAIAAIAKADTINQLYSNLFRASSVPLSAIAILLGGGLVPVACCALLAEIAAGMVSVLRLKYRQHIPLRDNLRAILFLVVIVGISGAAVLLGSHQWTILNASGIVICLWALTIAAARILFPEPTAALFSLFAGTVKRIRFDMLQGRPY